MCQLNLYIVPKNIPTQKVMSIFEKNNSDVIVSEHYKLDELVDKYEFYCTSGHCDCNSIISRLQEEDFSSFEEYKVKKKQEDIEKLNRIKDLKATEDYEVRVKKFEEESGRLLKALEDYIKYINEYQIRESERISSLNLQEEEKTKIFNEVYFAKIKELNNELEENEEYQNAMKKYQDFLSENSDLFESIYFNAEDFEERIVSYDCRDFGEEFSTLKNICTEILEISDELCIYPFWQNEEPLDFKELNKVCIESLCIEDLIFLPYKNLLKIKSQKL